MCLATVTLTHACRASAGRLPHPVRSVERVLRAAHEPGPGQGAAHHRATTTTRQGQGTPETAGDGQES